MDAHDAAGPVVMPRRCLGLASVDLDDEQVVYDPARRRSFRLNRTAGLVLDRCDGRTSRQAVVDELAGAFGADPDQVGTQLGRILEVFARDGLIDGLTDGGDGPGLALAADLDQDWGPPAAPSPSPGAPSPMAPSSDPASGSGEPVAGQDAGVGWRRALDVAVRVRTGGPDLARGLDPMLGSLPAEPADAAGDGPRLDYELRRTAGGSVDIRLGATSVGDAASTAAAFSYLQWHLNQQVIAARGGAVAHPCRSGAPGVGRAGAVPGTVQRRQVHPGGRAGARRAGLRHRRAGGARPAGPGPGPGRGLSQGHHPRPGGVAPVRRPARPGGGRGGRPRPVRIVPDRLAGLAGRVAG